MPHLHTNMPCFRLRCFLQSVVSKMMSLILSSYIFCTDYGNSLSFAGPLPVDMQSNEWANQLDSFLARATIGLQITWRWILAVPYRWGEHMPILEMAFLSRPICLAPHSQMSPGKAASSARCPIYCSPSKASKLHFFALVAGPSLISGRSGHG